MLCEQNAQIPMAVVGIVMKFFRIVISIVVGMATGCIPVVGYNVELFPGALIGIFGAANESAYYTAFAIKAFRVYLCMMIFACVNKACFFYVLLLLAKNENILKMANRHTSYCGATFVIQSKT